MVKGHKQMADRKRKKVATQLGSIIVQSVSHTKLRTDIIRQGQRFLDDRLRENMPLCHTRPMIFLVAKTNSCDIKGVLTE